MMTGVMGTEWNGWTRGAHARGAHVAGRTGGKNVWRHRSEAVGRR